MLAAAAALAEVEYRTDKALTAFGHSAKGTCMSTVPTPGRGEVWLVDFDPSVGAEIQKNRPAVVIRVDSIERLPLRMVVPITDWKPQYAGFPRFVFIQANSSNGLTNRLRGGCVSDQVGVLDALRAHAGDGYRSTTR